MSRRYLHLALAALTALISLPFVGYSPAHADDECTPGVMKFVDTPPPALSQLGISRAWKFSTGNVTVAVVDSGVSAENPHLKGVVLPGVDLVEGTNGWVDTHGHGTAIAAQIAGQEVEGSGVVGVAPSAKILPIRVYVDESSQSVDAGKGPDPVRTAQGIRVAADKGAKVISVALSTTTDHPELAAAVNDATRKGALVVASAGNVSEQGDENLVKFPAAYEKALSVTAVDAQGLPSPAVSRGVHVEVAAPGANVATAFLEWGDCVLATSAPSSSFATGYAAGVAALVADTYPEETPEDWKYRLTVTALRPVASERDEFLGWGILAPASALNFVNDGSAQGPPNPRFTASEGEYVQPLATPHQSEKVEFPRFWLVAITAGTLVISLFVYLLVLARSAAPRRR